MADVTYRIIITDTSGEKADRTTARTASGSTTDGGRKQPKTSPEMRALKKFASVSTARTVINTVARNEINRVELRTGSQALQERISFAYDTVNSVIDSGMAIAAGAQMGGVAGAGIAAVLTVATKAISIANAQTNQNLARQIESISIQQRNIRAGANGNRGGQDDL